MDAEPLATRMQLLPILFGHMASKAVSVAAELGIADLLADGAKDASELAAATKTDEPSLRRLLRVLAALGIVVDREDGRFEETPSLYWFRSSVPGSLRPVSTMLQSEPFDRAWNALEHSIQTGETALDHVYGMGLFDYYAKNPASGAVFNDAMTSISAGMAEAVADAFDFSAFGTIMDVAGGHGQLLATILASAPDVRGILFDLPKVVAGAGEILRAAGVSDRCEIVSGNFFDAVPRGADAYVMKSIIHDWKDAESITILSNCREAMKPDGRILVIDRVLPEHMTPDPTLVAGALMDLNMMVVPGGIERTESQWRSLFERSGLSLVAVHPTPTPLPVIEVARHR